jgi:hypothetical protein
LCSAHLRTRRMWAVFCRSGQKTSFTNHWIWMITKPQSPEWLKFARSRGVEEPLRLIIRETQTRRVDHHGGAWSESKATGWRASNERRRGHVAQVMNAQLRLTSFCSWPCGAWARRVRVSNSGHPQPTDSERPFSLAPRALHEGSSGSVYTPETPVSHSFEVWFGKTLGADSHGMCVQATCQRRKLASY